MSWFIFIAIGVAVGAFARLILTGMTSERGSWVALVMLGVIGAVASGWMWDFVDSINGTVNFLPMSGSGINLFSLLVACAGAVSLIALVRMIDHQTTSY